MIPSSFKQRQRFKKNENSLKTSWSRFAQIFHLIGVLRNIYTAGRVVRTTALLTAYSVLSYQLISERQEILNNSGNIILLKSKTVIFDFFFNWMHESKTKSTIIWNRKQWASVNELTMWMTFKCTKVFLMRISYFFRIVFRFLYILSVTFCW